MTELRATLTNATDGIEALIFETPSDPRGEHKVVLRDRDAGEIFAVIFGSLEACRANAIGFITGGGTL
jgi:hypothetical protein